MNEDINEETKQQEPRFSPEVLDYKHKIEALLKEIPANCVIAICLNEMRNKANGLNIQADFCLIFGPECNNLTTFDSAYASTLPFHIPPDKLTSEEMRHFYVSAIAVVVESIKRAGYIHILKAAMENTLSDVSKEDLFPKSEV